MTQPTTAERIVALRRQRFTGRHIAREVGVSPATVSRVLRRAGLSRLKDLEPVEPPGHYERERPGDMIHIDIKKLGRFERVGHRISGDRTGQSNSRGAASFFLFVSKPIRLRHHSNALLWIRAPREKSPSKRTWRLQMDRRAA